MSNLRVATSSARTFRSVIQKLTVTKPEPRVSVSSAARFSNLSSPPPARNHLLSTATAAAAAAATISPTSEKKRTMSTAATTGSSSTDAIQSPPPPPPSSADRSRPTPPGAPTFESLQIRNREIKQAPGVHLTPYQEVIVGSILDLFEANPTLPKLTSIWSPEATFSDPLTVAKGYDRYAAQWYGLAALFRPVELQRHTVAKVLEDSSDDAQQVFAEEEEGKTGGGGKMIIIEMEMENKYTVRGTGGRATQIMGSLVRIWVAGGEGGEGKVVRVEDKWGGTLPGGAVVDTFRKINAVTVPALVKVPKTEEEDMKMKAEREGRGVTD